MERKEHPCKNCENAVGHCTRNCDRWNKWFSHEWDRVCKQIAGDEKEKKHG